jgi:hypothetical protein
MGILDDQERQHAFARGRVQEDDEPQRARPRLGGSAPLPAPGAATDLFSVALEDLSFAERAAPGWCLRLGVPEAVPTDEEYDVHELLVELTIVVAGVAHALEVNVFPGCTVHVVGEQIAAKLKWGTNAANVPPGVSLRWQLSRGLCETRAARAYTVQVADVGQVPAFATGFALFSGAADVSEDIQLDFATHAGPGRVIQHYTRNDLLQAVGAFAPLPPGAGQWRWLTPTAAPVRLVFSMGTE